MEPSSRRSSGVNSLSDSTSWRQDRAGTAEANTATFATPGTGSRRPLPTLSNGKRDQLQGLPRHDSNGREEHLEVEPFQSREMSNRQPVGRKQLQGSKTAHNPSRYAPSRAKKGRRANRDPKAAGEMVDAFKRQRRGEVPTGPSGEITGSAESNQNDQILKMGGDNSGLHLQNSSKFPNDDMARRSSKASKLKNRDQIDAKEESSQTEPFFGADEASSQPVGRRRGLEAYRSPRFATRRQVGHDDDNARPQEYSQQQLLSTLNLMQLPDSQQQEMKIDDSQSTNLDAQLANQEKSGVMAQSQIYSEVKGQQEDEDSSYSSSVLAMSQQRSSLSPNRERLPERNLRKSQLNGLNQVNKQEQQSGGRSKLSAAGCSDSMDDAIGLQEELSDTESPGPSSSAGVREVPAKGRNRRSRIHIIKEKQRQLNRVQKMRDVTGEFLLSKVEPGSDENSSIAVEKAAFGQRMNLRSYKKSLVFTADRGELLNEARQQKSGAKRAEEPHLEAASQRTSKSVSRRSSKKSKKAVPVWRAGPKDASRNDQVNSELQARRSEATDDGPLHPRELLEHRSPPRSHISSTSKRSALGSPNPVVCEPQKKPLEAQSTNPAKSLLFERNANLQDINENLELCGDCDSDEISEGSRIELKNNGSTLEQKTPTLEARKSAASPMTSGFLGSQTKQQDGCHSIPPVASSMGNVTLEHLSQQHEQREQLLFQAAAIMKLNDSCLRRSRWPQNVSQTAASIVEAKDYRSKEDGKRAFLMKSKHHSSQNNLRLGPAAMAAQGQHRYSEYDKNSSTLISNNFVLQQSSIPLHDLADESNSVLQNMGNSSHRLHNPGSPPRGPPLASLSDKMSIQNKYNNQVSQTPQRHKIASVTPIIGKHNRRRLEDVELIKEASMEVSHYKVSQQIQRKAAANDAVAAYRKEDRVPEPRPRRTSASYQKPKHSPLILKTKKQAKNTKELAKEPKETLDQLFERSKRTPNTLEMLKAYMSTNDIPCAKYHHTVNGAPLLFDKYKAVVRLSKDGKTIKVYCFKPEVDYQSQEHKMKKIKEKQKQLQKEIDEDCIKREKERLNSGPATLDNRGHIPRANKIRLTSSNSSLEESQEEEEDEDTESSKDEAELTYEQMRKQARRRKRKLRDDNVVFKKTKSWATCNVDDIEGFVYGPFSSRFWMMRKHINSIDNTKGKKMKLPFYAWQCLSLQLRHRNLDLVIEEDRHMKILLQFLILSLKTVDGQRHSAVPHLNYALQKQSEGEQNLRRLYEAKNFELENLNRVNLQNLSEATGKKFSMLKIRMKLSFLAFVRNQTITEMFLHTILESYHHFNRKGLIRNPWPKMDKQLIGKILAGAGEAHKFQDKGEEDKADGERGGSSSSSASSGIERYLDQHKERVQLDHYQTAKQRTFALKAMDKNRVVDIFKGILDKQDHHMPADQIANGWVQFKFDRARIGLSISRLRLLRNLGFTAGPTAIKFQLKIIDLEKEMFSLLLTRGTEVKIPHALDQTRLPSSFRFYDPIINLIKLNFSGQSRDFSKLKRSISYAFDQKFQSHSLFRVKEDSGKLKAQHNFRRKENKNFDFMNSQHTMQIQQSKYITLDDNFVDQASRIKQQIENSGQYLNKYQKEQRLFDELGVINIKYIHKDQLLKEKQKSLNIKRMFSQQLDNLRRKGERIQLMAMVDDKVIEPLQNRLLAFDGLADDAELRGDQKNKQASMRRLLTAIQGPEGRAPEEEGPDEEQQHFVFDMFSGNNAGAAEDAPVAAREQEVIRQMALREEHSTKALLEQLEEAFKVRFMDPNAGHDGKAIKAQTDELLVQASEVTEAVRQKNLQRQRRREIAYFQEKQKDFEKKHQFVDRTIEGNILYFCPHFDDKEKQQRVMRKIVEHNEALLGARERARLASRQDGLRHRFQNETQSLRTPSDAVGMPQPNTASPTVAQQSTRQPLRKIQTSQGVLNQRLVASSANKSILQSKPIVSSTKASNQDKTKTFSNFSQAKARECFSQDTSTPSIRKTNTVANENDGDKAQLQDARTRLPQTARGPGGADRLRRGPPDPRLPQPTATSSRQPHATASQRPHGHT